MNNTNLFGEDAISIENAAKGINVSNATIRNWIKMGYLESAGSNYISKQSVDIYLKECVGKQKLNSRANKLYKQKSSNEDTRGCDLNMWQDYESSLSESYRNREGIYYTPDIIVKDMFSKIDDYNIETKTFLDPCCGSGNFIVEAINRGILPQNIYGYDTDPNAVEITKRRIEEATGYQSENIKCDDFLRVADSLTLKVDYIFTNPPWGKKMDKRVRDRLVVKYNAGKSSDSSSLFMYASLPLLKEEGRIGFLLQEAFFNIGSYVDIRSHLLKMNIDYLIDYGRAFKTLLTRAYAVIATNKECCNSHIVCQNMDNTHIRTVGSFTCNPQRILNLKATAEESEVVKMLFNKRHSTLKDRARWGLGIVTGDNKRFCRDTPAEGFEAIYRGSDITTEGFKSPSLYINPNLSLYQQVAPVDMYRDPRKIVYKFISSDLCFLCDTDGSLILNSANFLILNQDFPISSVEFTKFLNSSFTNWLFKTIYSTHKILRGNLEVLPIFLEYFDNGRFCEKSYIKHLNIIKTENGSFEIKR